MNEASLHQERKEETRESKLFGLPRPLTGAFIGALLFTIILLVFWMKDSQESATVFALLLPGIGLNDFLGMPSNTLPLSESSQEALVHAIEYIISCLPPATLGSLIVSRKTRTPGIILLTIYCIILFIYGLLTYVFLFTG